MNNCETDISGDCPVRPLVRGDLGIDAELCDGSHQKPQSPSFAVVPDDSPQIEFAKAILTNEVQYPGR